MLYPFLKSILYALLPKKVLLKYKQQLRVFVAWYYKGKNYRCNICSYELRTFIDDEQARICPKCGALPRTRRLYTIVKDTLENTQGLKVLHFSPAPSIANRLEKEAQNSTFTYYNSDFVGEFKARGFIDLTDNDLKDNSYDIIICYHILEHITNDEKAMSELYRICNHNGKCFIQTPFQAYEGEAIEDDSIVSPEARLKAFGQEDHVRIYTVESLKNRLEKAGFNIEISALRAEKSNYNGFKTVEYVLIAHKC